MARLSKRIQINESDKTSLQSIQRADKRHCIRQRCQMILLKTEGYSSYEIGKIVGSCEASVNSWVSRYEKLVLKDYILNQDEDGSLFYNKTMQQLLEVRLHRKDSGCLKPKQLLRKN